MFVIFHLEGWRWLLLLLGTLLVFRKFLRELMNSLLFCLVGKLFFIGILVKGWMRWNLLRLNRIWMIWWVSISSIRMLLLKKSLMKKKRWNVMIKDFICLEVIEDILVFFLFLDVFLGMFLVDLCVCLIEIWEFIIED